MNTSVDMKKYIKHIVIGIVIFLVLIVIFSSVYTVQENEFACVLRFEKIVDTIDTAGLHFKVPFIDEVNFYPRTKLLYDLKPSDVFTSDSKAMSVDSFVIWQIVDPLKFYQAWQTISNAEDRLNNITYNVLKNVIGTVEQNSIISSADQRSRDYVNNTVFQQIVAMTGVYGIEVIDVNIKKFELPEANEQAVFRRMISDRNRISELYKAEGKQEADIIRNEVDKSVNIIISNAEAEAEKIIAEGESEYMKILAATYNTEARKDFYLFMRGLESLKTSLSGKDKTIILDKDSELARILVKP